MNKILITIGSLLFLSTSSMNAYTHTYVNQSGIPVIWFWIGYSGFILPFTKCEGDYVRVENGQEGRVDAKGCCLNHIHITTGDGKSDDRTIFERPSAFSMYCRDLTIILKSVNEVDIVFSNGVRQRFKDARFIDEWSS